jgi:hypothetical protein
MLHASFRDCHATAGVGQPEAEGRLAMSDGDLVRIGHRD